MTFSPAVDGVEEPAPGLLVGVELVDQLVLGATGRWVSLQARGGWSRRDLVSRRPRLAAGAKMGNLGLGQHFASFAVSF
jgi:hypothetical protein